MRIYVQVPAVSEDFVQNLSLGDSVAIGGACMTVVEKSPSRLDSSATPKPIPSEGGGQFAVDVSSASLACTVGLDRTGAVNLEKSLTLSSPLGGHWVTGHVDGLGKVSLLEPVYTQSAPIGAEDKPSYRLCISVPPALAPGIAPKGSVTVNGVSLTVNAVRDTKQSTEFELNLIPHTWANTTLQDLRVGDAVNIEIDYIARYIQRLEQYRLFSQK